MRTLLTLLLSLCAVDVALGEDQLPSGVTVNGTVVDAKTGEPIAGVLVSPSAAIATTLRSANDIPCRICGLDGGPSN